MTHRSCFFGGILVLATLCLASAAPATDIDGPDDCSRNYIDEGDAPEGILAYPGVLGHFPTCVGLSFPPGTMELACPAISSPPGPTGYVEHFSFPGLPPFWLGCYSILGGGAFYGVDTETEGKSCLATVPSHCVEGFASVPVNQDECYGDGSDACLAAPKSFAVCTSDAVTFTATSCHQVRNAFLNILVDWNQDGDWNDNFVCPGQTACAYEWAVKNATITLLPGCNILTSPAFRTGPRPGLGWMRITLTLEPVVDSFPWGGAALDTGGYEGGETEDYPVKIETDTPAHPSSWGSVKATYR